VSLYLRQQKKITRHEFVTLMKNRWALYAYAKRFSVSASRAICHYTCHPAGETTGQKPCPSGWRSFVLSRQRAMKGASLFIGSASYGRCILNVYTKRSSTSLGESSAKYNIISLTQAHLRKQLTRARFVTSVLRSNHYAFSLSLSNNCREGPNNIEFRSKSFQRYHRELKRYFKIR